MGFIEGRFGKRPYECAMQAKTCDRGLIYSPYSEHCKNCVRYYRIAKEPHEAIHKMKFTKDGWKE